jgi:glycosyltransferase involved in cell wall biosynthesis
MFRVFGAVILEQSMKVIFAHNIPFALAHGGQQTLIESLMRELNALGVEVEPQRWWDPDQSGDILHYIGRPSNIHLAQQKGLKTVMTENFDTVASESSSKLWMRALTTRVARKCFPGVDRSYNFYRELDALVYVVSHEYQVIRQIYGPTRRPAFIIPHGLEPDAIEFLKASQQEGEHLVSIGTICPRKNSVLLATCAREAKVPIVFLGKPFSEEDPYYLQFRDLVDDHYVRYVGYASEAKKYEILRSSRGLVLLSLGESGCISVYEAAAAGLPLLLSDLPWATHGYPVSDDISLVPLGSVERITQRLKIFYEKSHRKQTMTFPIGTWADVAKMYLNVYETILR